MDQAGVTPSEETRPGGGGTARGKAAAPGDGEPTPRPVPRDADAAAETGRADPVDEGSEASFPASDPPAHSGTT
jgi:hypothetical protein